MHAVDFLLRGIDDATDHDQLIGRIMFDDESERAIGLDQLLSADRRRRRFATIEAGDFVERIQQFFFIVRFQIAAVTTTLTTMMTSENAFLISFVFVDGLSEPVVAVMPLSVTLMVV